MFPSILRPQLATYHFGAYLLQVFTKNIMNFQILVLSIGPGSGDLRLIYYFQKCATVSPCSHHNILVNLSVSVRVVAY